MFSYKLFSILAHTFLATINSGNDTQTNVVKRFPDDFLFGVSTAAYQIEGAWNVDGKGPSIWDEFTHSHPDKIQDFINGDVGPNSYDYYLDDLTAIKHLNMDFYRFSISWPRILPDGDVSNVNEKGVEYYNKVIDKLLDLNIRPMVTMYHYDLPQKLQLLGGFTNPIIVDYFKAYANLLFERFGDRVKYWITFNQPRMFCGDGYGSPVYPPAVDLHGIGEYLCGHNVLKAHASVYHLYGEKFYGKFLGQIGISMFSFFYYSHTNDTNVLDYAMQFTLGWFAHPIFSSEGNYPAIMISKINDNSKQEGHPWSRLPRFSRQWIDTIRGSADFFGLNYYSSRYVKLWDKPIGKIPSYFRDSNLRESVSPKWKHSSTFYSVPEGLGDILRWIKKEYKNPMVILTENGWPDTVDDALQDNSRIEYLQKHLQQIQHAVLVDRCNVKGYAVWSLIDNFEWVNGYTLKFGLYSVNMTSPRKERTPKWSANFMKNVTTTRQIPDHF